jgi:hypothetical protein
VPLSSRLFLDYVMVEAFDPEGEGCVILQMSVTALPDDMA